ncbi:MAG: MFS transporter [Novosphingobium sp.]
MTTAKAVQPARIATSIKAGYGIGQIAGQLFRDTPSLLLLFFLTNVMGISPAIAGTAIFIPKVVLGALFDLGIGAMSDRIAGRFPRRNWFVVAGLASPVAMLGIFAVPDASAGFQIAWVMVTFSFYMAVYSSFSVPYLAMLAEMTSNPRERTELMGWKHSFGGIGLLLSSSVAPMAVSALGTDQRAHLIVMGTVGVSCLMFMLIAWRVAGRIVPVAKVEGDRAAGRSALAGLASAFADRRFVILSLSAVVMTISAGIGYASFPFFVKYSMARAEPLHDLGIMAALMGAAVIFGSPLWVMVSGRIGKVPAYVMAAAGHGLVVFVWGLVPRAPIEVAYVLSVLLAVCNAGWGTIVLSLLSDCIAQARDEYGENRAGSYSAIWSAIEKAGIALGGTLIVGVLLSWFGFDSVAAKEGLPQTAAAMFGILFCYSFLPGVAKLVAAGMIWKFVREPRLT